MQIDRRAFATGLGGLALSTIVPGLARSQQLESPSIRLGVANKAHLYYLPVTTGGAPRSLQGLRAEVAITDFEGGAQSLDALLAGTVDVVTGAYEHTLRSQAKGQDIRAAHRARPVSGHGSRRPQGRAIASPTPISRA